MQTFISNQKKLFFFGFFIFSQMYAKTYFLDFSKVSGNPKIAYWTTAPWTPAGYPSQPTDIAVTGSLSQDLSDEPRILLFDTDVSIDQLKAITGLSPSTSFGSSGGNTYNITLNEFAFNQVYTPQENVFNYIGLTDGYLNFTVNNTILAAATVPIVLNSGNSFKNLNTFSINALTFTNLGTFYHYGEMSLKGNNYAKGSFQTQGSNFIIENPIFQFAGTSQLDITGTLNFNTNANGIFAITIDENTSVTSAFPFVNITGAPDAGVPYGFYLGTLGGALQVSVQDSGISQTFTNFSVMYFPERFGTIISQNGYSSPGLSTADNYPENTVSMFDIISTNGNIAISLQQDSSSPYHLAWSNVTPSQWATISGQSNSYTGTGYSDYGVNGVFGLWVDSVNNHHTLGHTAGTNSPNNTATMLNTMKKSNQLHLQSVNGLDSSDSARASTVAFNDELNKSEDLIAQQSMVQQLAERNLDTPVKHWSVYVEPKGSWGQVFKQKQHFGNTFQTAGTRVGFDYLWANQKNQIPVCIGLGVVGDYLHLWGQRAQHSGNFYGNEALGNVYMTIVPKAVRELSLNLIAGGGYSWYTFHRDLFADSSVVATGKSKGPMADVFFQIEYVFRHQKFEKIPKHFKIAPIAALQYTYSQIDAYQETGAGRYNLHVNEQKASTLSTLIGFRTNYEFRAESDIKIRPELMILWQYQYLDPSITSSSSYLASAIGPDVITATLPGLPRNTLVVGGNLKVDLYDYGIIQLDYDLLYNSGFINNVFFLELKGKF